MRAKILLLLTLLQNVGRMKTEPSFKFLRYTDCVLENVERVVSDVQ